MENTVQVKNLFVKYGESEILKDVSFEIEKGDFIGLAGPNGGGKTTLIKSILGLIPISSGEVFLFEKNLKNFSSHSKIGYLPQAKSSINPLFPSSVEEIILLGLLSQKKFPKIFNKKDRKAVYNILSLLEIEHLREKNLNELSGGQQQKVLLARSLVSEPELLIFDEPSTALDPESRKHFFEIAKKINKENKTTIILITHDTGFIGDFANKLLYIDREVVFFGTMQDFCPSGDTNNCFEKKGKHIIWHQHD